MSGPETGKEYPLAFGHTFREQPDACYHLLSYKFKPQSAGHSKSGSLQIDQNTVSLRVPNAAEGQGDVTFEGQWAPSQPGFECVAIFDGSQWRLELLDGAATNVRHVSGPTKPSPSAPSSPVVTLDASDRTGPDDIAEEGMNNVANDFRTESVTPSINLQPSVTPSLSRQPSADTSPSVRKSAEPALEEGVVAAAEAARTSVRVGGVPDLDAGPTSRGSPSVPPPNSFLATSSTSSASSSESDEEVQQPSLPLSGQQLDVAAKGRHLQNARNVVQQQAAADRPDFEIEFFEDGGADESESGSESSGDQSEEEAKHF